MRLYKSHLAGIVSDQTGMAVSQARLAIDAMAASILRSLAAGDPVNLRGFGKFWIQTRKSRSGRNPRTGRRIDIQSRRAVGFAGSLRLKHRLNSPRTAAAEGPAPWERRADPGRQILPQGRAVVRISGIPVCEFAVRDISGNGTGLLVPRDSMVLRNLRVGQMIEIHMLLSEGGRHSTLQRSRIAHITPLQEGTAYPAHVLVGLEVIDRI